MHFFVDLQGFKSENNRFIVKEICLLSKMDDKVQLYIIKPPFHYDKLSSEYKIQARWLKNNFHGFDWKDGFISYLSTRKQLLSSLPKSHAIIFVKGAEKIEWIRNMFRSNSLEIDYFNIEDLGYCTVSTNDIEHCKYHDKAFVCAYQNAMKMKQWFCQNISQ